MVVVLWDEESKAEGVPRAAINSKSMLADGEGFVSVVDIVGGQHTYHNIVDVEVSLMKPKKRED